MKLLDRISLAGSSLGILLGALIMFVAIVANNMTLALFSFVIIAGMLVISGGTIKRQK